MRKLKIGFFISINIAAIYLLGPHPEKPFFDDVLPYISNHISIDDYVSEMESNYKIKDNNEAKIIWADSSHQVTEYAIVYLHGFSASQMEGDPVHRNIAKQFHCNLYLARLAEHGLTGSDAMQNLTAENLWVSAKEAYAIGKKIGKKVILIGTSTGGTLALQLAANFPEIAGLILYSPNIEINNPSAPLLNDPWGLQIARMVQGGKFNNVAYTHKDFPKYWNPHYRLEATVALENLIEATMKEPLFKKITQPCLALYYYKDEAHQDKVVKVTATQRMFSQISTPDYLKVIKAMPKTGNHVLASPLVSKDAEGVEKETAKFIAEKIIKVLP
jgi:pimeloyl-ACP methyl ester carboxylesterase